MRTQDGTMRTFVQWISVCVGVVLLQSAAATGQAQTLPTVAQGGTNTFAGNGWDSPAGAWDVIRVTNGITTPQATNANPNGWSVRYSDSTSAFTVSAPAAALASDYEVRYYDIDSGVSAQFAVVAGATGPHPTQL